MQNIPPPKPGVLYALWIALNNRRSTTLLRLQEYKTSRIASAFLPHKLKGTNPSAATRMTHTAANFWLFHLFIFYVAADPENKIERLTKMNRIYVINYGDSNIILQLRFQILPKEEFFRCEANER